MDGPIASHRRACDGFARTADAFRAEQWSLPTPCTEWDARALVEHVIGFHEVLILRPAGVRANRPREGPAERWRATATALFTALEADGAHPMLGALTTDVLVHTWDLARARGTEAQLDRELCEAAYAAARSAPLSRENGMIGAEVAVPAGADVETRLVALYGRDPVWRATR